MKATGPALAKAAPDEPVDVVIGNLIHGATFALWRIMSAGVQRVHQDHLDTSHRHGSRHGHAYLRLLAMTVLSFIAMYVLMYAMVDKFADVYPNWNQAYMAALMTAPMVVFELFLMRAMYPSRALNGVIIAASVALLAFSWFAIRHQWGIGDRQFLRSMVPHHSGAILMCREATIGDPGIRALCDTIMAGQQREIDQMNAKLGAPD